MFDSNQTILLLGSVAETDTLAHLSNATVLEAEPQNDSNQKSVNRALLKKIIKINIIRYF